MICLKNASGNLNNTNLVIKYPTENEVAFLFYAAVIHLHSSATEIMNKKIERV